MKDGTKIPPEYRLGQHVAHIDYYDLVALGWWAFKVSEEDAVEVTCWIRENIGPNEPYGEIFMWIVLQAGYTATFRLYEDATLFKLSWPECSVNKGS